jgi:hypothetical protein
MNFVVLGVLLLVFVLGVRRSADLATALKEPEQRRSLVLRGIGFLAMSAWLHSLPALLLTIYMRYEGMLASEVLTDDDARATVVSLFLLPYILFVVFFGCWGALCATWEGRRWKLISLDTLFGYSMAILFLAGSYAAGGFSRLIFMCAVCIPFILYGTMTLLTPLAVQIKLYWAPFALVGVVTGVLLALDDVTHHLVAAELGSFGTGGGRYVVASSNDSLIAGRLVLFTQTASYIAAVDESGETTGCLIRIPNDDLRVATGVVERRPHSTAQADPKVDMKATLKRFAESTRVSCGSNLLVPMGTHDAQAEPSTASSAASAASSAFPGRPAISPSSVGQASTPAR